MTVMHAMRRLPGFLTYQDTMIQLLALLLKETASFLQSLEQKVGRLGLKFLQVQVMCQKNQIQANQSHL